MQGKLALFGGMPVQPQTLRPYVSIGQEEKDAALRVIETGSLSNFVACGDDRFYGGPVVREFEASFAGLCGMPYAVSFNSATSGLVAAVGALNLGLGDEVIVPAQTMSASAAAVLAYNAVPVFADVEERTYGLDPESVRSRISERTKALMIVHLYGHPARMDELMAIARERRLYIIEDCAQSPLATYRGALTGSFGDIGVFSFNFHKHANCGEGGVAVTHDADLHERLALIRNHGEVKGTKGNLSNTLGWNFRLTELQAAIALEQTKKLPMLVKKRRDLASRLSHILEAFGWVRAPLVEAGCEHSYYDFPMQMDLGWIGLTKKNLLRITQAENLPITESYRPLYWQDIYQKKIVYSSQGFPFNHSLSDQNVGNYQRGSCPQAEALYESKCLTFEICSYELEEEHMNRIGVMFHKIEDHALQKKGGNA
jgi:dTDP-4-amino-4,6-dideoxygalactose transaminase